MKVNFSNNSTSNQTTTNATGIPKRKHRKTTLFFAAFTFLGMIWIGLISDIFSQAAQVEPKDYAAEEILNMEKANQSKENVSYGKLKDENATQYVNDAITDVFEEIEELEEETEILPEEIEDPDGEEF